MPRNPPPPASSPWPQRLTLVALALTLSLVIARVTMPESLRDVLDVRPNTKPVPRFTGPAAGVGLDLLACVPALLVLLRRRIDKNNALTFAYSFIPLAELSLWMLASTFWASDKFSSLVLSVHWAAAAVLTWSTCQLVRDWTKFRLVLAAVLALLPIYTINAVDARMQLKDNIKFFEENRAELLANNGLEPGSFAALQFEKKLHLGEVFGFFTSPNTFGGVTSLLLVMAIALLVQTLADKERRPWSLVTLAAFILSGLTVLLWAKSKGAGATLAFSLLGLAALALYRKPLAQNAKRAFWIGVIAVILAIAAVIGHGLYHGSLPTSTLTFRWKYWIGAAGVFKEHPLLGVGWGNFGNFYLAHRLPSAPEEIKDPHNLLVRFFTELGAVGGVLAIAWQLRLWWDLTRPITPPVKATNSSSPGVIKFLSAVAAGSLLLYLLAGADWAHDVVENILLMRLLFLGVAILIPSLIALRLLTSQAPDDRPAPWALYGVLLAIAGMLLHNLVDFSLFEPGPLFLFALLTGAALGIRKTPGPRRENNQSLLLAGATLAWCAALCLIWIPLVAASAAVDEADEDVRASRFAEAGPLYDRANRTAWNLNPDYALRAAAVTPMPHGLDYLKQAIKENPHDPRLHANLAAFLTTLQPPDAPAIKQNYETALKLDPNNVPLRLAYADTLAKLGDPTSARAQYQSALQYDDLLDKQENKRLTPDQIKAIRQKIQAQQP